MYLPTCADKWYNLFIFNFYPSQQMYNCMKDFVAIVYWMLKKLEQIKINFCILFMCGCFRGVNALKTN